jgi:hypothetical protein
MQPAEHELFTARFAPVPARYFAPLPFREVHGSSVDYLPFLTNMSSLSTTQMKACSVSHPRVAHEACPRIGGKLCP